MDCLVEVLIGECIGAFETPPEFKEEITELPCVEDEARHRLEEVADLRIRLEITQDSRNA